jgi:L-ribulose-5-phosphate 4-epimerase
MSQHDLHMGLKMMAQLNSVIKDTHGNLSVRYDEKTVYIKPSGMQYDQIGYWDLCWGNVDGSEWQKNKRKPSVDLKHHLSIYRRHPWIKAICHTHSPYAAAFAAAKLALPCYTTEQADYFGGDVLLVPFADYDEWGDMVEIVEGERAVLLESHGVLTFGSTPIEAVNLAAALESCAEKNFLVRMLNSTLQNPCDVLPAAVRTRWHKRYLESYGQDRPSGE